MSQYVQSVFIRGKGNELTGKMKALHSSSVLVYNFFECWRGKPLLPLEQVLTTFHRFCERTNDREQAEDGSSMRIGLNRRD